MHMHEENIEIAQRNAKEASLLVSKVVPKPLIDKENTLVERFLKSKGNSITKMRFLYDFMGEVYSSVSKLTPCKKGCSSCCYYKVSISETEIAIIEKETGKKRNKSLKSAENYHGQPCPFLVNNVCSIYQFRPFMCRRHTTMTKTNFWCHPDRSNNERFELLGFSEIDKVYFLIRDDVGNSQVVDIRQVFG